MSVLLAAVAAAVVSSGCSLLGGSACSYVDTCEIDSSTSPPTCKDNKCAVPAAECPQEAQLCRVLQNGAYEFCAMALERQLCKGTQEACGVGSLAHCEYNDDMGYCMVRDVRHECAELSVGKCLSGGYCDQHATSLSCMPRHCILLNETNCAAADHCYYNNKTYVCETNMSCTGKGQILCAHGENGNCGWSEQDECTDCSGAADEAGCDAYVGCAWFEGKCIGLRQRCNALNPAQCLLAQPCTPDKGDPLKCTLWSESFVDCEKAYLQCSAIPYCSRQGLRCDYRDPTGYCPGLDVFMCAASPQCWWEDSTKQCFARADYCSYFDGDGKTCPTQKDASLGSCTYVVNSGKCMGHISRLRCEDRFSQEECMPQQRDRCGWDKEYNRCVTLSGCAMVPKEFCTDDAVNYAGFECEWDDGECEGTSHQCRVLDLRNNACDGRPCGNLSASHHNRQVRVPGGLAHGTMGIDLTDKGVMNNMDHMTGKRLCNMHVGSGCTLCRPPTIVNPFVRLDCPSAGGTARLTGQLCLHPSQICKGNFSECAPPPFLMMVSGLDPSSALHPSVAVLVTVLAMLALM